ncbi:MAG TPA: histidinol-phosphatase [Nitrospiraceae bacterium]|nr:histidinol-phosphatase [Nitrospiraceae bacterium]
MHERNRLLAEVFRAMANLLATQRANPYRVRAYRRAAETIISLEEDIADILKRKELDLIPGVGRDLAGKIQEYLETGTIRSYEELKSPLPEEVSDWSSLPGMSESIVGYLYFRLGIRTLTDLDTLVRSHLMRTMPGFTGPEDALLQAIHARQQPPDS